MFQVLTEQGTTYEEGRRITSSEDTRRTVKENQYQHYWIITKVKWKGCYHGHCGLIYKNDSS